MHRAVQRTEKSGFSGQFNRIIPGIDPGGGTLAGAFRQFCPFTATRGKGRVKRDEADSPAGCISAVLNTLCTARKEGGDEMCTEIPFLSGAPLFGLVLTGGKSTRMHRDKALLWYRGRPHLRALFSLLSDHCDNVWVSNRQDQAGTEERAGLPQILDAWGEIGPMGGVLSAFQRFPEAAWLAVACDMPCLDGETMIHLIRARDPARSATCFLHPDDGRPEPLCTIYEPAAYAGLAERAGKGDYSLRRFLESIDIQGVVPACRTTLQQVNSPEEYRRASRDLGDGNP